MSSPAHYIRRSRRGRAGLGGPAPVVRPRGRGYPLLAPVAAALAALGMATLVLGVGEGRYGWDWWWVIPAGLLFMRRRAGRGGVHRDSGRN